MAWYHIEHWGSGDVGSDSGGGSGSSGSSSGSGGSGSGSGGIKICYIQLYL